MGLLRPAFAVLAMTIFFVIASERSERSNLIRIKGALMKRETFLFTRTMRDIKTGFDLSREGREKIKTTAKLMRGGREIQPKIDERHMAVVLEQEKRRFARQMEALERGRKKVGAFREKLAGALEKNKRLMTLRYALAKQYWSREEEPEVIAKKSSRKKEKEVKLSY